MIFSRSARALALVWAVVMPGFAAADAVVLRAEQVTESALIDALGIDEPEAPPGAETRGIRMARSSPQASQTSADAASKGKAHLLMTFDTNSAVLTPETTRTLDVLARAMKSDRLAGNAFIVEGHADPRGDPAVNRQLSQARAVAVMDYLISRHAIIPERLKALGKGSSEVLNVAKPDAPENRRVTIVTERN